MLNELVFVLSINDKTNKRRVPVKCEGVHPTLSIECVSLGNSCENENDFHSKVHECEKYSPILVSIHPTPVGNPRHCTRRSLAAGST